MYLILSAARGFIGGSLRMTKTEYFQIIAKRHSQKLLAQVLSELILSLNHFFGSPVLGSYTSCKTQSWQTPHVVRSPINAVFGTLLYQVQNSELAKVLRGLLLVPDLDLFTMLGR